MPPRPRKGGGGDAVSIRVLGLDELRKALRKAGGELPKELAALNQKAAQIVADEAARRAPRGPHEGGGRVSPIFSTIKASKAARAASVAIGGARSPHAAPTEFGGTLRRRNSTARTRVRRQPYLYPAIAAKRDEVAQVYGELIDDLTRRIGG